MPKAVKSSPDFDFGDWAGSLRTPQGSTCRTCSSFPSAVPGIQKALQTWSEGKGVPNIKALHELLRRLYGYTPSDSSLRRHIQQCEPELWDAVRLRNG